MFAAEAIGELGLDGDHSHKTVVLGDLRITALFPHISAQHSLLLPVCAKLLHCAVCTVL